METGGLSPSDDGVAMDQAARMDELSRMLGESSGGHGQVTTPEKKEKIDSPKKIRGSTERARARKEARMCVCVYCA